MDVFTYLFPFCLLIVLTLSWNIETRLPVIFSKSKNSYFGFSVALHDNSKGNFALITATKANSSIAGRKKLHQPGALYKCDIVSTKCEEVVFEENAEITNINDKGMEYISKEDDMWLGVSLDVQPLKKGNILTCAHLWKNRYYKNFYLTNGACYIIDRDFKKSSYKALLPFIDGGKQSYGEDNYYYAFGEAGISAVFNENNDELVLGAPGIYDWAGAVVNYTSHHQRYSHSIVMPSMPGEKHNPPDSYIGYSVGTGNFFEVEHQQFVAGAPRGGANKGRVYVFESSSGNQKINVRQKFDGERVGEYFGASVLGIDVNNDSHKDLLVGSPFYSLYSLPSGGDEGKVYVYISTGMALQKSQEIMGSKKTESRFGTTIANAGDVNQDGYKDVAIGAPYEDGQGAVYIYHGSENGILPEHVQRIAAKNINPFLLGFGISISRGKDIDNNNYPDLLIGSYLSDQAVLFKTRPIVQIYANINFDPQQINTNSSLCSFANSRVPCFNVSYCLHYTGNHVPDQLNISIKLTSARKRDFLQTRRYLMYQNKYSSNFIGKVTARKENRSCFNQPAYVIGDSNDFITPIQMTLTYKLVHDVNKENVFCKSCPVVDPRFASTVTRTITFQTGCGEDSTCISDLSLKANVSSNEVIVGEANVITLAIELHNRKEPAYMAEIRISLPLQIQIINQENCEYEQYNHQMIICQAGNPLRNGSIISYDIKFDTSLVSSDFEHVTINVTATTASEEANVTDNQVKIDISLKVLTDITIIGYSDVEQIVLGKGQSDPDSANIVHVYTVLKILPTPISFVSVEILIPTTFTKSHITFLQLENVGINEGSNSQVPASCNFSQVNLQPVSYEFEEKKEVTVDKDLISVLPTPRPKRSISNQKEALNDTKTSAIKNQPTTDKNQQSNTNYILTCTTSTCTKIPCIAGPFTQRTESATFRIYGFVNISSLRLLDGWDTITLRTEGKVRIINPRENVQPKDHRPDEAKVITTLVHMTPLPEKRIAIWIVAASIAAGILLLVLIMLGLIQLGFFRRKKKEDMQKMMMKAELKEWEPYMITDEEVKKAKQDFKSETEKL